MIENLLGKITQGDCIELMSQIPDGAIDLCFADPPFNVNYEYDEYSDNLSEKDYKRWTAMWGFEAARILKPDGTLWVAIGDEYVSELDLIFKGLHMNKRSHVIWYYTFGVNCLNGFTRSHTHLLYYTKNKKKFTFNADDPACRVPSARQLIYNDKRANPKGRLPDNTWILRPQDIEDSLTPEKDVWAVPRVAGTFKEREGFHGCQMPELVMERIIRSCSNIGEIILDPMSGSGTTACVAKRLGRIPIGFDLSSQYVEKSSERLAQVVPEQKTASLF